MFPHERKLHRCLKYVLFVTLLFGCSTDQKKGVQNHAHVVHRLIDDGPPLGTISNIIPLNTDSLLVTDFAGQIQLFVNFKYSKLIGKRGKGHGEYQRITGIHAEGDSVFVFDNSLAKVMTYSLATNRVLNEIVMWDLTKFGGFTRCEGIYYFVVTDFHRIKPEQPLLYRLSATKKLEPLALKFAHLDQRISNLVGHVEAVVKNKNGKVFTILPFTNKLWIYDTSTDTFDSFGLGLRYADEHDFSGSLSTMDAQMRVLEKIEMPGNFFLLNNTLAVWSLLPITRHRNRIEGSRLRFYSYQKQFLKEIQVDPFVFEVTDSSYVTWGITKVKTGDHPYEIRFHTIH